ncbi:MAG: ATP-binding protein [Fluviicola sp.]|nr:ATP-binding protein [Fluviicola sp.]
MDSQEFRDAILLKRPRYAKSRIPVLDTFANKGNKKSEYNQFGPYYELYIYAFTLGLKRKSFLPLPPRNMTADFIEIGKWKRDSKLVDFLMMIIFSHSEEIGFSWNELENMEDKQLNEVVSNIISFIEGYANGGLEYIQKEWEEDKLLNSHYLFVDLMASNSTFPEEIESNDDTLRIEDADEDIIEATKRIIKRGESTSTEFKSTLRVNLHTGKPDPKMEHGCLKTIAGFMNTNGGTLLIGVSNDKEILGLDTDFESFGDKSDLLDEFQKHLDNQIEKYLGNSAYSLLELSFPEIENKTICSIKVKFKKNGPIYLKSKANGDEFFIRRSASTKALKTSEIIGYKENYWG